MTIGLSEKQTFIDCGFTQIMNVITLQAEAKIDDAIFTFGQLTL